MQVNLLSFTQTDSKKWLTPKKLLISIFSLALISSLALLALYEPEEKIKPRKIPIKPRHLADDIDLSFSEDEHRQLSRKFASEGMILAKNVGLPIQPKDKVVLFGKGTTETIYGGWGSGEVYNKGTNQGMTPIKVDEGFEKKCGEGKCIYQKNEKGFEIDDKLTEDDIKAFADKGDADRTIAILTISRRSGEGGDRAIDSGQAGVLISDKELATHVLLEKYFDQVVVVLNVGSVMEIQEFVMAEKTSILISYLPGMEAGNAIADVLVGDVNPCGRLSDTWAKTIDDYPTTATFMESIDYVKYREGIFVGYRYFEDSEETQSRVQFPFGWGLSYTTFEMSSKVEYENEVFKVLTTVENTGDKKGKQVVQVYVEKPQNEKFVKAKRELVAFGKTKELEPGDKETLAMTFDLKQLASFDTNGVTGNKASYVIEKGEYNIYVGANVAETRDAEKTKVYTHKVDDLIVTEKLTNLLKPEDNDVADADTKPDFNSFMKRGLNEEINEEYTEKNKLINLFRIPEPNEINFKTVVEGKHTMEELVKSMTDEELAYLTYGHGSTICGGTGTIGGAYPYGPTEKLLIPPADTMDGPAGLRQCEPSVGSTAWPSSTLLASTFDVEILEKVGLETGKEARKLGTSFWLAPGMNIHRSPLCGRNFEYYAEDPLLSGKLAAAITKGLQQTKVSITLKHFAYNNKEQNRGGDGDHLASDSRVSERASREIYLKGFEIAVKEAKPWAIMTSYNRVNGIKTSANHDLLTGILRGEWGFDGLIMTDWGTNSHIWDEINAGGNVKMPGVGGGSGTVLDGLKQEKITREQLEKGALYILNVIAKTAAIEKLYYTPEPIDISGKVRVKVADNIFGEADGIGKEKCEDEDGGINPTNTYDNTFITIMVHNDNEGERTARVRFSGGGMSIVFMKDDEELGSILDLPKAQGKGGWQDWETTPDFKVKVPKGDYELKIFFKKGGGNINWFEFDE